MLSNVGMMKAIRDTFGKKEASGRKRKAFQVDETQLKKRPRMESGAYVQEMAEDEKTVRKHMDVMNSELKKREMDVHKVIHKMTLTEAYRRNRVNEADIDELLEEFPALHFRHYLLADTKLQGVNVRQFKKLLPLLARIEQYSKERMAPKTREEYCMKYKAAVEETLDESHKTEEQLMYVCQLLPSVFREKENLLFVQNQKEIVAASPVIVQEIKSGKRSFQVFIENKALLKEAEKRFSYALEAWFASYWSFGLQYPAGLSKTCLFFEYYILNFTKSKLPASIKTWKEKLFS